MSGLKPTYCIASAAAHRGRPPQLPTTIINDAVQEEAKRTQLHSSAAALEARASKAEQQLAAAQRQADAARSESRQLAAKLATVETRLAEAQQSQVFTVSGT